MTVEVNQIPGSLPPNDHGFKGLDSVTYGNGKPNESGHFARDLGRGIHTIKLTKTGDDYTLEVIAVGKTNGYSHSGGPASVQTIELALEDSFGEGLVESKTGSGGQFTTFAVTGNRVTDHAIQNLLENLKTVTPRQIEPSTIEKICSMEEERIKATPSSGRWVSRVKAEVTNGSVSYTGI